MSGNGPNYLLKKKKVKFNPGCLNEDSEQKSGLGFFGSGFVGLGLVGCFIPDHERGRLKNKVVVQLYTSMQGVPGYETITDTTPVKAKYVSRRNKRDIFYR